MTICKTFCNVLLLLTSCLGVSSLEALTSFFCSTTGFLDPQLEQKAPSFFVPHSGQNHTSLVLEACSGFASASLFSSAGCAAFLASNFSLYFFRGRN